MNPEEEFRDQPEQNNENRQAFEPSGASPAEEAEQAPEETARPAVTAEEDELPIVGDKQPEIYADAHYEPAAETTTPPRYYTPPERTVRARAETKREKRKIGLVPAIALCLVCALLGGMLGVGIFYGFTENRLSAVEQAIVENARADAGRADAISALEQRQNPVPGAAAGLSGTVSPAQIYALACQQTVGITTTVTTSTYFGQEQTGEVSGSGFILSEDGYIITNYHVIEYAVTGDLPVTVVMYDGTVREARIVGAEEANDIAVLKIDATGLSPVTLGDSDAMQVGDEIYAVGNPMGELEFSMSTGHVSALDRVVSTEGAEDIGMFQLDAAVNPGNSGGPVYNDRGQVVGVVTAKYRQTGVEGLGFAIPINDAARIAEDLIENGYVTGKAYMGVWLDERYNSMVAQYYNMPLGAYVSKVEAGSAAERAGLEEGDVITRIGERDVTSASDLRSALRQYSAGDRAEITVYRAGESRVIVIVFDEKVPESVAAGKNG